jgi:hypothetical protein
MNRMSTIEAIAEHVKLAEESEQTASEHNWAASQLIYEAVQDGVKQKDIAEAIGKSETHISFMKKCWIVRVVNMGIEGYSLKDLGSFYDVYNSAQVRGESADREPGGEGGGAGGNKKQIREPGEDEHSGHGIVVKVANLLDRLADNRGFWDTLTEDDLVVLSEAEESIRSILADVRR